MRTKLSIIMLAWFIIGCNVRKKEIVESQKVSEVSEVDSEHNNIENYRIDREMEMSIDEDTMEVDNEHNEEIVDERKGFQNSINQDDNEEDENHDNADIDLKEERRIKDRK